MDHIVNLVNTYREHVFDGKDADKEEQFPRVAMGWVETSERHWQRVEDPSYFTWKMRIHSVWNTEKLWNSVAEHSWQTNRSLAWRARVCLYI